MNKSTLHNYCTGVFPRNLLKLKELSDLLDISLSDLLFGKPAKAISEKNLPVLEGRYEITVRRISDD